MPVLSRRALVLLVLATALALSLAGFATHGRWRHAAIDWRGHVEQCLQEPTHQFPVHYEGTQSHGIIWSVEIEGAACRQLVSGSLFDNKLPAAAPPFPP